MYLKRIDKITATSSKTPSKKKTLGQLIQEGEKKNLFEKNFLIALKQTNRQRNEFIHKLYSIFNDIDECTLPTKNLVDTDVLTYNDYAWQLKENLEHLAEVISKK